MDAGETDGEGPAGAGHNGEVAASINLSHGRAASWDGGGCRRPGRRWNASTRELPNGGSEAKVASLAVRPEWSISRPHRSYDLVMTMAMDTMGNGRPLGDQAAFR